MSRQTVVLVALAAVLVGAFYFSTLEKKDEFKIWKQKFGVEYSESEDLYRNLIFQQNVDIINAHNSKQDRTYDMGLNQFSGMTDDEFAKTMLTPKPYNPEWENADVTIRADNSEIDWTTKGAVSPIKNQGNCGSCWAFSAVATLESLSLMQSGGNGNAILSEQQLVDCSSKYGNQGCNGGFNYKGLAYVKDNGISFESEYPYTAKTQTCHKTGGSFKIGNVVTAKGCPGIQTAVLSRPIGVSADATNWSRYASGVFNNCATKLNHDITLVGYNAESWKIKNSWGATWGEKGFIRLAMGNTCGVCIDLSPWPTAA